MASLDFGNLFEQMSSAIDDSVEHKFCERTVLKTIFYENSWWMLLFFLSVKTMTTAETKEDINLCFFLATKTDNPIFGSISSVEKVFVIGIPESKLKRMDILFRKFEL
jgi:hypothetical protein